MSTAKSILAHVITIARLLWLAWVILPRCKTLTDTEAAANAEWVCAPIDRLRASK